jgi:hypothetical protein
MTQPPAESASPPNEEAVTTPSESGSAEASAPETSSSDTSSEDEEGGNSVTFLIFGAVVVVLAIVLAVQVPAIQTQLHLRKLQAGLAQPKPVVEQEALDALLAEGPELLTHLADELEVGGPERQTFRIFLIVRLLAPMEGSEASQVLIALTADKSPEVRANVYEQIAKRVEAKLLDRKLATEALAASWAKEKDEVARAFAASSSVRLGDPRATWPLIWSIRSMSSRGAHLVPNFVESLKVALGPDVVLDLKAPPEEVKRQMFAIEATYQAQGGKIPAGQDLKSVLEKRAASASGGAGQ